MSPSEFSVLAESAQCFKRILAENEEKAYGLNPLLVGDILKNYNAARGLIYKAQKATKERADNLAGLLRKTEGPNQGELDLEAEQELAGRDVPGQLKLTDGLEVEEAEEIKPTLSNEWKAAAEDPAVTRELIIRAVYDGSGRTEVLELCKSKLGISKFEAETLWDDLIRDGLVAKVKGKYTVTPPGLEAGNLQVQRLADGLASILAGADVRVKLPESQEQEPAAEAPPTEAPTTEAA